MVNASQTGEQLDENGAGNFIVYADFNCSFCYALNERLHAMNLDQRVEFRAVQHAPASSSSDNGFEILSELTSEVAELRRRAPSIPVNVPLFRPSTAAAAALVNAVNDSDPVKAGLLRRQIYRALWVDGQDISRSEVLNGLLQELEIEPPAPDDLRDDELIAWQSEWDCSPEFDRSIPVLINGSGETVIGFPLQPELDSFLQTGSMVSDGSVTGVTEPQDRQRILVLDRDVPSLRMIIGQMQDAQVEIVENFSSLVASAVNLGMPDLVIVDTALLGGVDSTDWWRNSTDSDLETAVPVIFVSDDKTTEAEVAAFEAGAADFIARPFHPRVLRARLNMHLQARRSQQQLNNIARVDALTSVCNRREFDLRLLSEWGRGARGRHSLALLMIDVDKFKEYNDHLGHLRGDECLIEVARILSDCMQRPGDLIARYGGEEFVVLLPEADMEGAMKVAEECHGAIQDERIPHVTSSVVPYVTVSIGVATMQPIYEQSCTLLVEQADIALYQAKQGGRNRICRFNNGA